MGASCLAHAPRSREHERQDRRRRHGVHHHRPGKDSGRAARCQGGARTADRHGGPRVRTEAEEFPDHALAGACRHAVGPERNLLGSMIGRPIANTRDDDSCIVIPSCAPEAQRRTIECPWIRDPDARVDLRIRAVPEARYPQFHSVAAARVIPIGKFPSPRAAYGIGGERCARKPQHGQQKDA